MKGQSRARGRPDKTRPATSPCGGARFRAMRAAGSRSQNERAFCTCSIVVWASWTQAWAALSFCAACFGIAVAKGREDLGLGRLALGKGRVGVAAALDELEPLGPMGRHLLPDRFERGLDLLRIREERRHPLDPAEQSRRISP